MATPVTPRQLPGRRAARKSAAACEEQLLDSPEQSETEGHGDSPFRVGDPPFGDPSSSRSKGKTKVTYKGKRTSQHSPARSSPKKSKVTSSGRKRRRSPSISDGDASDPAPLSSLVSYEPSISMKTPPKKSAAQHFQASPKSSPGRVNSVHKGGSTTTPTPVHSFISRGRKIAEQPWEAARLGTFVWVLVDKCAKVVEAGGNDEDPSSDSVWWPARITSPNSSSVPLCASLIGELSPSGPSTIEITSPSEKNVLSMLNGSGELRFSETDFIVSTTCDPIQPSPRKKNKRDSSDIESKWRAAVKSLVLQHDDDNDGLPQAGEAYGSFYSILSVSKGTSSPGKAKNTPAKKKQYLDHDEDLTDGSVESWFPPPCDSSLTVPGELVLAREKKDSTIYWPAKIDAYIPPTKPSKPGRYAVVFLDTIRSAIPRELFFTSDEDGFGTCKLGQWESSYEDVLNDTDGQQVIEDDAQDFVRSPSPPSSPQSSPDKFCGLSIPQQLAYVKPVLVEILSDGYMPAKQRHTNFIKGGALRQRVAENAGVRGMMSPADVEELQRCLLKWVLRDERRAKRMVADEIPDNGCSVLEGQTKGREADDRPEDQRALISPQGLIEGTSQNSYRPLPRQRGCEAYEALSGVERIEYCSNVLLPEAVLQILLWRSGERSSISLLSPTEEEALHKVGMQKCEETDWVHDIVRLRHAKVRSLRKLASSLATDGTRSRPKQVR